MMNRFLTLLFAASCLTAVGQVPDYVPTDGLVGWWPFSGSAQNLANADDSSVVSGAILGGDRFGNAQHAYVFDGLDDQILTSNFGAAGSGISASYWYKSSQVAGAATLISFGGNGPASAFEVMNNYWSAGTEGPCYGPAFHGNSTLVSKGGPDFPDSLSWHHVVVVLPEGAGSLADVRFYVDGLEWGEICSFANYGGAVVPLVGTDNPVKFGNGYAGSWSNFFDGTLDDIGLWHRSLTEVEIQGLFNAPFTAAGCTDPEACNYEESAILDDGSCLDCALFAERCGPGTLWDSETQMCIGDGSGDINLDGCVQLNDLLDLLSAYGNCGAEELAWQCGDPLEYQGYDYETVQIGEQCWFAENARYMPEVAPAAQAKLTPEAPLAFVYGYQGTDTLSAQAEENYQSFGALYNFEAVSSWHLCPSGWHVPSDEDWFVLDEFIGLPSDDVVVVGWRGTQEGASLKSAYAWDGTDDWGFNALPGGRVNLRQWNSEASYFGDIGQLAHFWTSGSAVVPEIDDWGETQAFNRYLNGDEDRYGRGDYALGFGMSVRCIKDSE